MLHDNEIALDAATVRKLVDAEFPKYSQLPLKRLSSSGSSNTLYRLGEALLVRLPRQPGGGAAIDKENRWSPLMSRYLPVEVPQIVVVGQPNFGYSESWSIARWIDGTLAQSSTRADQQDQLALAEGLARVVRSLRAIDVPPDARSDPSLRWYRGDSLASIARPMQATIRKCHQLDGLGLDLDLAADVWNQALKLPSADQLCEDAWYHSDLVAENLLMSGGELTAVLDFGGLGIGDPTIDLHGAWELFDPVARQHFRGCLDVDEEEWQRGRAWALAIALGVFAYYWDKMPTRVQHRLDMARAVLADAI